MAENVFTSYGIIILRNLFQECGMFSVPPVIVLNKKYSCVSWLISLSNNRYLSEYGMRIFS